MDDTTRVARQAFGLLISAALAVLAPTVRADVAGRTATSSGVSATGEAQYQVPLVLPPGTNGMTPQLALSYGSHGGESISGQGWNLAGLSAIHRCPKTVAQDGVTREVKLDLQDRFCLNGNQLKLTSGTYGVAGSTYQTEMEQFARVTAYGVAGNGPAYFIAEYKNGLIYEFGNTTDSRIESKGVAHVRTWAVNKIRDRSQNEILFNYTEDTVNGSYRINTIQYTGNPGQGLTPRYTVQFTYETRPVGHYLAWYRAGGLIKFVTRLDKVDVFYYTAPTSPVRSYDLTYEQFLSSAGHSRLASIDECSSDGQPSCPSELLLTYQSNSAGIGYLSGGAVLANVPSWSDALPIDVNGDGRTDLLYSSNTTAGSGTWMVMLANSSGGFNTPTNTGITNNAYTQAIPIDYNSDGLQDVLVPYSGGTWWVMLGTATGLAVPSNTGAAVSSTAGNAAALDVNGDGLDDLVWAQINVGGNDSVLARLRVWGGAFAATTTELLAPLGAGTSIVGPVWGRNRYRSRILQPDFNGDGNKDFLVTILSPSGTYTWEAVLSGGAGVFAIGSGGGTMQFMTPFDLNGDGLSDIIYTGGNNSVSYRLSDGKGFRPYSTAAVYPWDDNRTAVVVDYDGDGYDDVLVPITVLGQKKWHIISSDGEQLLPAVDLGITATTAQFAYAAEYTGEGIADGLIIEPNSDVKGLVSGTHPPDVLKTVTDAYGNVLTLNYTTLTKGSYTRGSTATYPQRDYQGPYSIVANTVQPNGIGGTFTTTYTYTGARFDLQGRGFLGFGSRTVTDSRSNIIGKETFQQGFPYTGLVSQHDVQQPGGSPTISQTTTTYQTLTLGTGFEQRKFPYASSSTEKHWEVAGTQNGSQIDEVVTTTLVDSYGTAYDVTTTRTEKTTANGIQPSATYTQRTLWPTANLVNNTTNWCLGRPGKVQQIQSHNQYSGTSITRTTDFSWDTALCRPTQAVVEPGSTTKKVTTDLGYDGFGNVNSQTIAGRNANGTAMTARTTTTNWGTTGQFPTTITNPLGQITQKVWELFNGWQTSETDPNGLVTSWIYDGVGHVTRENRPDGSFALTSHNSCSWGGSAGLANGEACSVAQYAWYQESQDSRGNKHAVAYFDRFDRSVLSGAKSKTDGTFSYATTEYDSNGNVLRESAPCWWGSCTQYWTTYTYDLVNRRTQASRPISQGDSTLQTTTTYYEGLTSRVVDAEGKESTKIANVVGLPARSRDHAGYYQNFDYDAFGSLKRVQDSLANTLFSATYSYSAEALRTQTVDMDLGTWNYTINSLGEISSYTDAKTQTFTFTYDALSRPLTRVETEGTTTWTWGNSAASYNIGQLASVAGPGGYSESFTYDNKSRLSQKNIVADATTHTYDYGYDDAGTRLLDSITYPTSTSGYRLKLKNTYTLGQLTQIADFNAPATVFWSRNQLDPAGHITQETLANGLKTNRVFDAVNGFLASIQTGTTGNPTLRQNVSYLWDKVGALTQRQDNAQGLTENFYYDSLHRLDYSTLKVGAGAPTTNLDMAYDAMGNITSKSDVGSYTYHATRKHAVITAGSYTFSYDNNGNMTAGRGATIARTSYNLPSAITNGSISTQFFYAPDRSYWKQVAAYTGGTETTLYLGGILEKVTRANGTTDWRHRIATPGAGSILYIRQSGGTNLTYSIAGDHLGSTSVVTDAAQALIVSQSFGAFGARRGSNWQGTPSSGDLTQIEATTRRGFTDHTMVDNLNLIHMNGRMYDPVIGRFLSADPYPLIGRVALPDPSGRNTDVTQVFNRYSYVDNNPLSYTDPTGFTPPDGPSVPPCSYCFPREDIGTSGACSLMEYCSRGPGFTYLIATPFDAFIGRLAARYRADLSACNLDGDCISGVFRDHIDEVMPASTLEFIMSQVKTNIPMSGGGASVRATIHRLGALGLLEPLLAGMVVNGVTRVKYTINNLDGDKKAQVVLRESVAYMTISPDLFAYDIDESALLLGHELVHAGQREIRVASDSKNYGYYRALAEHEVEAYRWMQDAATRSKTIGRDFLESVGTQMGKYQGLVNACANAEQSCLSVGGNLFPDAP